MQMEEQVSRTAWSSQPWKIEPSSTAARMSDGHQIREASLDLLFSYSSVELHCAHPIVLDIILATIVRGGSTVGRRTTLSTYLTKVLTMQRNADRDNFWEENLLYGTKSLVSGGIEPSRKPHHTLAQNPRPR